MSSSSDSDTYAENSGGERYAKKPKMDTPYAETKHRNFKFMVEDKTFFVSPHFMAEISPVFDTLCLGNFKEGKEGKAELKDVKWNDFMEMLDVLGADVSKSRKEIEASNCVPMIRLAHIYAIDILMTKCVEYIKANSSTVLFTLELLKTCEELRVDAKVLRLVASRLASFHPDLLFHRKISREIKDPSLCAAIFVAATKGYDIESRYSHVFVNDTFTFHSRGRVCRDGENMDCKSKKTRRCQTCELDCCVLHARQERCSDRYMYDMEERFGKQPRSSGFALLLDCFFDQ